MKLLNTIIWGIIKIALLTVCAFILIIIINSAIRGDKLDPNDPRPPNHLYNYWHPSWDENNPRTIIPEGKGTITYGDTLTDSIRWEYHGKEGQSEYGEYIPTEESDEYRMWIGNDGDTIWE